MQGKTGSRMPRADMDELMKMEVPFVPLAEQRRIAARLREQMAEVERAHAAVQAQLDAAQTLLAALLRDVFDSRAAKRWGLPPGMGERNFLRHSSAKGPAFIRQKGINSRRSRGKWHASA